MFWENSDYKLKYKKPLEMSQNHNNIIWLVNNIQIEIHRPLWEVKDPQLQVNSTRAQNTRRSQMVANWDS